MLKKTVLIIVGLCGGLCSVAGAENLEKSQKKELEAQVKTMTAEAERLEKSGQLAEARIKYAESQALIEMKDVAEAIKHLDEKIHKRAKDVLSESRKLYESHKFKEAAASLDDGMKLQALQPVLAYDSRSLLLPPWRSQQGPGVFGQSESRNAGFRSKNRSFLR